MQDRENAELRRHLADFLRTRRERLSPAEVGLPDRRRRRTPGLRREEVAVLADVGTTWYTWLEQGREIRASEAVLDRLATALRLNPEERTHLFLLARQQTPANSDPIGDTSIPPSLRHVLDTLVPNPAYVTGRRCDILAWNQATCLLFGDLASVPEEQRNIVWLLFTDPLIRERIVGWEPFARAALASLRACNAQHPGDVSFQHLIKQLREASPEFRRWWRSHEVRRFAANPLDFEHPEIGRLTLCPSLFLVAGDQDLSLFTYTAAPGSESAAKLEALMRQPVTLRTDSQPDYPQLSLRPSFS